MSEQKNTNAPQFVAPMTKGKNAEFATGLSKPNAVGCDVPAGDGITATTEFAATNMNPGTPTTFTNNTNHPNLPGNTPLTDKTQKNADTKVNIKPGNPKAV